MPMVKVKSLDDLKKLRDLVVEHGPMAGFDMFEKACQECEDDDQMDKMEDLKKMIAGEEPDDMIELDESEGSKRKPKKIAEFSMTIIEGGKPEKPAKKSKKVKKTPQKS